MVAEMQEKGGFSFDLCRRNEALGNAGVARPGFRKTGTTIVGAVYKDGVVLGADTRATGGEVVADKNCEKIAYVAPKIYCCGAGTAADTVQVSAMVSSQLELHRYATGRSSRVITALTLFKTHLFGYQGNIGAALVLGGYDLNGPHLHTVYPHGSTDTLPFATMGSGSLAAMSIFESRYKENMTKLEAMELVSAAVKAGIFNDLGSGSNVDLCVISAEPTEYIRGYEKPNPRPYARTKGYEIPRGHTKILRTHVEMLVKETETETVAEQGEVTAMEEE